jgi:hypothetical protein
MTALAICGVWFVGCVAVLTFHFRAHRGDDEERPGDER